MRADRRRRFAPRVVGDGGAHAWTTAGGVRTAGARACRAERCSAVQCAVRATVAAIVQRSSVVDAGADAAEVVCESRWTQGVMEDGEVEALGQLDE